MITLDLLHCSSCSNGLHLLISRSNVSAFEDKMNRLEKDIFQMREERNRLSVALDFSKEEKSQMNEQLKELSDKMGNFIN